MASIMPQSVQMQCISKSIVQPLLASPPAAAGISANNRCNLTPWDLRRLGQHYMHVGFVFSDVKKLQMLQYPKSAIIDHLHESLSLALLYYYPLAGRLVVDEELLGIGVSLDCNGEGAELIHAAAQNVDVAEVLSPLADTKTLIHHLFPLKGAVNYDGVCLPLFAAQLTELADGIFLGCSFSHTVGDGASFTRFLTNWAEISKAKFMKAHAQISRAPFFNYWFENDSKIIIPCVKKDNLVRNPQADNISQRLFDFSSDSLDRLTRRVRKESCIETISSFEALCALLWMCVTRARDLAAMEKTTYWMGVDNRMRVKPRLHRNYFGNAADIIDTCIAAGDLLNAAGLGRGAKMLHERLATYNDGAISDELNKWKEKPTIDPINPSKFDSRCVVNVGSPRFDLYGCDFGFGRPVGLRSGESNWFDGSVMWWPGKEGRGSVELEICLAPAAMHALESDSE